MRKITKLLPLSIIIACLAIPVIFFACKKEEDLVQDQKRVNTVNLKSSTGPFTSFPGSYEDIVNAFGSLQNYMTEASEAIGIDILALSQNEYFLSMQEFDNHLLEQCVQNTLNGTLNIGSLNYLYERLEEAYHTEDYRYILNCYRDIYFIYACGDRSLSTDIFTQAEEEFGLDPSSDFQQIMELVNERRKEIWKPIHENYPTIKQIFGYDQISIAISLANYNNYCMGVMDHSSPCWDEAYWWYISTLANDLELFGECPSNHGGVCTHNIYGNGKSCNILYDEETTRHKQEYAAWISGCR